MARVRVAAHGLEPACQAEGARGPAPRFGRLAHGRYGNGHPGGAGALRQLRKPHHSGHVLTFLPGFGNAPARVAEVSEASI